MRRTGRASHCLPLHVLPGLLLLVALVPCNVLLPGLPAFPLLICQLLLAVPLPLVPLRGHTPDCPRRVARACHRS